MDEHHRPAFVRRLNGIEGLRGLAVASVLVYHVWSKNRDAGGSDLGWGGKWVLANLSHGVTLFFTLSGFLLYLPFVVAALREQPGPSFGAYLRNRALRILPAYWFILLVVALVLQSARIHEGTSLTGVGAITDPLLLLRDALLSQNYSSSTMSTGISPAWSLAVEAVFYIILPLLVIAGLLLAGRARTRRGRSIAMLAPALFLGAVGLVGTLVGARVGGPLDLSFLSYAHLFTLGMAVAVLYVDYHDGVVRLPRHWRPAALVALPIIGALAVWLGQSTIPERGETMLISVDCALLLALVVLTPGNDRTAGLTRAMEFKPIAIAGVISYSVYLWHVPVILFLDKHNLIPTGGYLAFATDLLVVATVTVALSMLTYRYVEKPALRLKSRRREQVAHKPARSPAAHRRPIRGSRQSLR